MTYPKTTTELSIKTIGNILKEIEFLSDNLLENIILNENLSPEAREILYGRGEQLSERIIEIYGRKLSQRINYWDSLKLGMKVALQNENFHDAAKLKRKIDYFKHFIKDDLPPSYF